MVASLRSAAASATSGLTHPSPEPQPEPQPRAPAPRNLVPTMQATYVRAADLFRQVLSELRAADLVRAVPSCPGWTVSDVVTHVHDTHVHALGPERADVDDVMAAYALAIPDDPALAAGAPFDTLDLTLHAWDVALACGVELRLAEDQLSFLEVFAREAGDRLYVEEGFVAWRPADRRPHRPGPPGRRAAALRPPPARARTAPSADDSATGSSRWPGRHPRAARCDPAHGAWAARRGLRCGRLGATSDELACSGVGEIPSRR